MLSQAQAVAAVKIIRSRHPTRVFNDRNMFSRKLKFWAFDGHRAVVERLLHRANINFESVDAHPGGIGGLVIRVPLSFSLWDAK
jgi:hypothetical protein